MMINKRLIGTVRESKKYIIGNVAAQWCSLAANIAMMTAVTGLLASLFHKTADKNSGFLTAVIAAAAVMIRFICTILSSRMGYLSSKSVKKTLREAIYGKLLRLGASYKEQVNTSEVVQVAVEGVEQLETYFGAYLPQFFYAMLAPLTLFAYLCFVNVPSAAVLLVCVPLIPIAIAAVQTWAKKLLSKYWGQYTALGDTFLENLQGLTTLKIYQSDGFKHEEMNREAENFRKITMKVLTMQLNSITLMDLIAYGGAALGVIMAATQFRTGDVTLSGCLLIILISADFFIPMRQLGSFFHVAMNGMAASDKIFRLLDLPEPAGKTGLFPEDYGIVCDNLRFSYGENSSDEELSSDKGNSSGSGSPSDRGREILRGIRMQFPKGGFVSIVGESGCGKSTVAAVLMGRNQGYRGSVKIGDKELSDIREAELMENITYISHQSYLFKGTVRENLLMGKPDASDRELWAVLERANLAGFLKSEGGLDTLLMENASNFSGGQRQRLALARALLHDSPVYIFDEATSNIDAESENDIMREIHGLAGKKTVILISHRLANVTASDNIYVMDAGSVAESGSHEELLAGDGIYAKLWNTQQSLENYGNIQSGYQDGHSAGTEGRADGKDGAAV
ncbi:ABC transporter ATP-binding protein/permease [uncultured Acetatifactor sp.]|jgi:ABC-type transport system involved in cytochrome bd biosynthesis fused ATPase/permease subunit|uniref:ABC transporter ATP-binding protein/permease n=1 Tax=uncultured Acetatifactor sp. TaxID=1671927 RepID=UPI002637A995|nr:ATP-binding cassette domain-containing protein [uncultured Acetatifactor sp.]